MEVVAKTFPCEEQPALLAALQSWRFPYWDWAAKKHDPKEPLKPDNYNFPVVLPYQGVEIKVPPSFNAKAQEPSFTEDQIWSDPSLPEPGEHRQPVANPFYQFTIPDGYDNMGDPKLGGLKIVGSDFKDKNGAVYHFPVSPCIRKHFSFVSISIQSFADNSALSFS